MSKDVQSANAGQAAVVLPDFRNLGVLFRTAAVAEVLRFAKELFSQDREFVPALVAMLEHGGFYEIVLLLALLALFFAAPALRAMPYRRGCVAVLGGVAVLAAGVAIWQGGWESPWPSRLVAGLAVAGVILWYFNWRHRVLSPALSEARLMALQARIRPHFLFNSLNTVLGLIRVDPRRAESVLENLAELYRALLSEAGTLVPLEREVELAKAYAEIEMMRLGNRLDIQWQYQGAPMDALVPPLILQPLIENAVYHGIEPSETGGAVNVTLFLKGEQLNLVVRNPCFASVDRRSGNRIALTNIRERLSLHFDAEAEMRAYEAGGEFVVQIRMPYKHA